MPTVAWGSTPFVRRPLTYGWLCEQIPSWSLSDNRQRDTSPLEGNEGEQADSNEPRTDGSRRPCSRAGFMAFPLADLTPEVGENESRENSKGQASRHASHVFHRSSRSAMATSQSISNIPTKHHLVSRTNNGVG